VGRFVSEDPLGFAAGDTNLNRYVYNSVINLSDPSGMQPPTTRVVTLPYQRVPRGYRIVPGSVFIPPSVEPSPIISLLSLFDRRNLLLQLQCCRVSQNMCRHVRRFQAHRNSAITLTEQDAMACASGASAYCPLTR
jgi:hypothetical protein